MVTKKGNILLSKLFPTTSHAIDFIRDVIDGNDSVKDSYSYILAAIKKEIKGNLIKEKLKEKWLALVEAQASQEHGKALGTNYVPLVNIGDHELGFKYAIAGGYIADLLRGEEENSKDIDIFFSSPPNAPSADWPSIFPEEYFLNVLPLYYALIDPKNENVLYQEIEISEGNRLFFDRSESGGTPRDYFYFDFRDPEFINFLNDASISRILRDRAYTLAVQVGNLDEFMPHITGVGNVPWGTYANAPEQLKQSPIKKLTTNSVSFQLPRTKGRDNPYYNIVWKGEVLKKANTEGVIHVIGDFDFLHTTLAYDPVTDTVTGLDIRSFIAAKYKILVPNDKAERAITPERAAKFIERGYDYSLLPMRLREEAEGIVAIRKAHKTEEQKMIFSIDS